MTAERIRQLTDDYRNELNLMNAKNRQISKEEDEIATLKSELARKNTQLAEEQRDKKRLERRVDALESEKLNAEKDASRWKKKYSNNEEKLNS
jgi:chromosome segregation ATPase